MLERPQAPAPVIVGTVLSGRWRLDAMLGAGGMAEVFRAADLRTGRVVAVKVLRATLETSPEAIQRFRREGELLVRLKNPAIVAADSVEALPDGRLYIVMELLEGETFGARLKRGPMTTAELAPVVAGCAVALAAAHAAGVVHRDLKPDNIFLVHRADGEVQVKLLDFGVSKVFNGEKLTQTGQVLGTPRYMSPEQLGSEPEVDHRVDLYSLGVILYEALSGRSPFIASTPTDLIVAILHGKTVPLRSVRPDVPAALEAVVMRAMAKVRDARHRAATELAEAFFDAAGIDARARGARRSGMATTPLGAMRATADGSPLEGMPGELDDEANALRPGTFSSFEAIDLERVGAAHSTAPAPVGVGATLEASPPMSRANAPTALAPQPVAPASGSAPRRQIPATSLSPIVQPAQDIRTTAPVRRDPSGAAPHAYAHGAISRESSASIAGLGAPAAAEGARSSQGLVLIGIGLVAGALTAGVVVAVLTWLSQMSPGENRSPPPPPPALADAGAPSGLGADVGSLAAGGAIAPDTTTGGALADRATTPSTTLEVPSAGSDTAAVEAARSSAPPEPGVPSAAATAAAASTPSETRAERSGISSGERSPTAGSSLGDATRALSRGDYTECVDILDDVIARGGTPAAVRRRGDCLMRLGEVREATRDYQRFCRLAPDDGAIAEVRGILAGLGASCP